MIVHDFTSLLYFASTLNYTGNENYRMGFKLRDKEGHSYEYLQFQQFYFERRYNGHPKPGLAIYVEDKGERKEIFHKPFPRHGIILSKDYEKEIVKMHKRIKKDIHRLLKEKKKSNKGE